MSNLTVEQLTEMLEAAKAENEALRQKVAAGTTRHVSLKVSEKGAVSVYGMGRFPVTLYAEQWTTLLGMADEFAAFIAANKGSLKTKADKLVEAALAKEEERKQRVAEYERKLANGQ